MCAKCEAVVQSCELPQHLISLSVYLGRLDDNKVAKDCWCATDSITHYRQSDNRLDGGGCANG